MRLIQLTLAGFAFIATADAELVITEIMSQSAHNSPTDCDWWELTNTGPSSVSLTGYSWDDDHQRPGQNVFAGITISAGESIIIRDAVAATGDPWKDDWGIGAEVHVYDPTYFGGSFPGLGSSDGVFLYNAAGVLVASATYPIRTVGFSNEWAANETSLDLSVVGENGAYQSANASPDVASPGHAVQSEPCSSSGRMMYWTDKSTAKIQRMNLDTGCVEDILTQADGLDEPRGLAIDPAAKRMYWADTSTGAIHRSALDGSGDVQLVTGLSAPADMALDTAGGKIYVAEIGTSSIRRVNLDGSGPIEDVVTGVGQPYYIELDLTNSRIYWSDVQNTIIHRANLDGTGVEDFITGLTYVRDMVLDLPAGKIYWGDRGSSNIQRANLDGTGGIEELFGPIDGLIRPHGLLLDAPAGKIYWTDTVTCAVHRGNTDGSGSVEDLVTGLDDPYALAIVTVTTVKYVDADATGDNNGSTWDDAFNYLQDALSAARLGDEIWVAQGIYKPDRDTDNPAGTGDRQATFQLKFGVSLKGGYAGCGQPDPDKRDIETYETILSGDLGANDAEADDPCDLLNEPTRSENSYHVVTATNIDGTDVLDGFTITAGNANGLDFDELGGGGMFNNGHDNTCNPAVLRCTFVGNSGVEFGGAMFNYGHGDGEANPTLTDCTFIANASGQEGGAICNWASFPVLTDCKFTGNFARSAGGGISGVGFDPAGGDAALINCVFTGNSAGGGGAMFNMEFCSPTLTNCSFSSNSATVEGGGIYNGLNSAPTLTNSILWHNTDPGGADESAQIHNYESTPVINHTCIEGWTGALGGTGNHGNDPLFADADGADDIPGTSDDNLRLMADSPCIDNGDNVALPLGTETDLAGHPRIIDGDCNHTDIVDMGAYEFNYAYMGDFDYECDVDFADFAVLAQAWLTEPGDALWNPVCDIATPNDAAINMLDVEVFAENWLTPIP